MKRFRAIAWLIAGAALSVAAPVFAASADGNGVRSGIEAWQKGDYAKAVSIWQPLADRGDPDAQFNMAQAYRLGRGVKANSATARTMMEKAAAQGHLVARTTLGLLLIRDGAQLDGLKWLKGAAEDGEPRAMLVYGTALINGDGVTQDRMLGYAFVRRSAEKGLRSARTTLDSLEPMMSAEDRRKALTLFGDRSAKTAAAKPAAKPKVRPKAKEPPSSPAPAPAMRETVGKDWKIQLGAFARPGAAQLLFGRMESSLAGHRPTYVPAGKVTRLLVGPYESKDAAAAACAKLSARGQPCLVVPPGK